MERRCIMIIVEGPNDQAFLRRVLAVAFGLKEFNGEESELSEISPFWEHWKPKYPKVIKKSEKQGKEKSTSKIARTDLELIYKSIIKHLEQPIFSPSNALSSHRSSLHSSPNTTHSPCS
ncbi:hypothetical protein VPK24_08685, partial [Limnothrix redekei LRLZ20PSL1]